MKQTLKGAALQNEIKVQIDEITSCKNEKNRISNRIIEIDSTVTTLNTNIEQERLKRGQALVRNESTEELNSKLDSLRDHLDALADERKALVVQLAEIATQMEDIQEMLENLSDENLKQTSDTIVESINAHLSAISVEFRKLYSLYLDNSKSEVAKRIFESYFTFYLNENFRGNRLYSLPKYYESSDDQILLWSSENFIDEWLKKIRSSSSPISFEKRDDLKVLLYPSSCNENESIKKDVPPSKPIDPAKLHTIVPMVIEYTGGKTTQRYQL